MDARGSRPNGQWFYGYRIPIFGPLDDPKPCTITDGETWREGAPDKFDYIYVECRDKPDLTDPEIPDYYLPYEGPNIYPYGVVKLLLDENVLEPWDCCWGVTATRSISPEALNKSVDKLIECVEKASWKHIGYLLLYNHMPDHVKQYDWHTQW